jgi:glycosyltransferase involved in cell wall biosynthesis
MAGDRSDMTDASIIIASRNEPWLEWTVENIRSTSNPAEIIIVYDGLQKIDEFKGARHVKTPWTTPQGVGKCRNWGAMLAGSKYLCFLDAHMDFTNDWLAKLTDTIKDNEKAIICSKSIKITPPHGMRRPGKTLAGAVIREIGTGTGRPLEVEWLDDPMEPGEIQCCLGACYVMHRKRYKELGKPWAKAFGWGTSEQTICMINELSGGVNMLADVETGHYYMEKEARGYIPDSDFKIGALFNRLRLIRMVYGKDSGNMMQLEINRSKFRPYATKALELLDNTDDSDIVDSFTVTMDEYKAKWWNTQEEKQVRKAPAREVISSDVDRRFI